MLVVRVYDQIYTL